ncbi:MAG: hypothetical protein ACYSWU_18700 [Planctomycetota bacterium]|jgi:hypothetical protein
MRNNRWARLDRLMRSLHLYTGLFLIPWMMVYAASAFFLNHGPHFRELFNITPPTWETLQKLDFVPDDSFPQEQADQAKAILRLADLEGPHRILPRAPAHQMIVFRICGTGNYRITWHRSQSLIIVEKQQPFSFFRLVHYLHFRGGYAQPYFALIAWAVVVDLVVLSILLWVVSGLYIWARRPGKRLPGGICAIAGSLLFVGLVVLLCM